MVVASNPIVRQLDKDGRDHENTWNDKFINYQSQSLYQVNSQEQSNWRPYESFIYIGKGGLFWNLFFIYKKN